MGQKDFTDWNGRKRKALMRPPVERPILKTSLKKHRPGGFKVKVDRFFSELRQFKQDRKRWHDAWERARERGQRDFFTSHRWRSDTFHVKNMRKLKEQYIKEGVYEQVVTAVKERMKTCVISSY